MLVNSPALEYELELRSFVKAYLKNPEHARAKYPDFGLEYKFLSEDLPVNPYHRMRGRIHHMVDSFTWDFVMAIKKELAA